METGFRRKSVVMYGGVSGSFVGVKYEFARLFAKP